MLTWLPVFPLPPTHQPTTQRQRRTLMALKLKQNKEKETDQKRERERGKDLEKTQNKPKPSKHSPFRPFIPQQFPNPKPINQPQPININPSLIPQNPKPHVTHINLASYVNLVFLPNGYLIAGPLIL